MKADKSAAIFSGCWKEIAHVIKRDLAQNFHPKKSLTKISDVTAHIAEMLISDVINECLTKHDVTDAYYLNAYKRLFIELITPFSSQHHEIACSTLTPNLMTFDMLSVFMESWVESHFVLLQQATTPRTLIDGCVFDICLATNTRFNPHALDKLAEHLVEKVRQLIINPPETIYIDYLLYKPSNRILLSDLLNEQLMSEVCDELSNNIVEEDISLNGDSSKAKTIVISEYKKRVKMNHDGIFVTEPKVFLECIRDILILHPYNVLKYVTIRVKSKKVDEHTVPFGLLGLMAIKAFFSTVLIKKEGCPYDSHKYTITKLSGDNEMVNLCYLSNAYRNCVSGGFLPYLSRQDLINYLFKPNLNTTQELYRFNNVDWSAVLAKALENDVVIYEDGSIAIMPIKKEAIGMMSNIFLDGDGKLYS